MSHFAATAAFCKKIRLALIAHGGSFAAVLFREIEELFPRAGLFTMATRGVFQLQKLTLHYCEIGGSSRAIREYIGEGHLVAWATARPHIRVEVLRRQNRHPYVRADYLTNAKSNIHQISVKNLDSWEEVEAALDQLSNRSGRKIQKITKPIVTDTPSVQGIWTPFLNLQHEPAFDVQILEAPPPAPAPPERPAAATPGSVAASP